MTLASRWNWRAHWHWAIPAVVLVVIGSPLLSNYAAPRQVMPDQISSGHEER